MKAINDIKTTQNDDKIGIDDYILYIWYYNALTGESSNGVIKFVDETIAVDYLIDQIEINSEFIEGNLLKESKDRIIKYKQLNKDCNSKRDFCLKDLGFETNDVALNINAAGYYKEVANEIVEYVLEFLEYSDLDDEDCEQRNRKLLVENLISICLELKKYNNPEDVDFINDFNIMYNKFNELFLM